MNMRLATDNRNIGTIREAENARRDMIRRGDLRVALKSIVKSEEHYSKVIAAFNAWASEARGLRLEIRDNAQMMQGFCKAAEKLLGDSLRMVLSELEVSGEITRDEITMVSDDSRWMGLLTRIAQADTCRALKMTKAAYKIATDTMGSYRTKLIGLKSRIGEGNAEASNAQSLAVKMDYALEVVTKRKDVIVDLNLKLRRTLTRFMKSNTCSPSDARDLTKEEMETLGNLI